MDGTMARIELVETIAKYNDFSMYYTVFITFRMTLGNHRLNVTHFNSTTE